MQGHSKRINKRITHFTWTLADKYDKRLTKGYWGTEYVDDITTGLVTFGKRLDETGSLELADELRELIAESGVDLDRAS